MKALVWHGRRDVRVEDLPDPSIQPPLEGRWDVRRTGGLLPPMAGVGKRIEGQRGETTLGPFRLPFRVEGLTLRYTGLLRGLVDELEPEGGGFGGRSFLHGVELGRFRLRRPQSP